MTGFQVSVYAYLFLCPFQRVSKRVGQCVRLCVYLQVFVANLLTFFMSPFSSSPGVDYMVTGLPKLRRLNLSMLRLSNLTITALGNYSRDLEKLILNQVLNSTVVQNYLKSGFKIGHSLARSLTPFTHSLAPHCARSFARSLTHTRVRG